MYLRADIADFAATLERRLSSDWVNTIKCLQDYRFYNLCENYQRPKRTFVVVESAIDDVGSAVLFKASDGSKLKPEDYLAKFEKFIKENPAHIDALEILLNRPKDFNTDQLARLRRVLAEWPDDLQDKFTERNLRRAYHEELVDIISIIRHAAKGEPLQTVETRIDRALDKVKAGKTITEEQEGWLRLIRYHLIDNLIMQKDDFDYFPIFQREGASCEKLNRIFDGKLEELVRMLNEAVLT